jgi:hypothetical protein
MPKFRVVVHGGGYRLLKTEKRFGLIPVRVWREGGFYATRFVEAPNEEEAIIGAFRIVEGELPENTIDTAGSSALEVDKVVIDPTGFDRYAPGYGFTFYTDDATEIDH